MATVVNLEASRRAKSKALDDLVNLVEDDLKAVNRTIVARMHSPVALIPQLAGHIVAAGGKLWAGGERKGLLIPPALVEGVPASCTLSKEEVFGPVLAIIPFETEEVVI